ncbi:MAG TPA: asparagine synthase-related protein [Candidatus Dormibacteraeota bacterium]|jgi:asparagine synthase (glutamine-hydrolysing)|nr:asparagine synthase-related protein [Candidatus Dormibacteraeota bacterium]
MTDPWLLRWDTAREQRPSLVGASDVGRFGPGSSGLVAFQGYLFDRGELSVGQSATDAGLVASAYERWHEALFDKLRGAFALAIWDEERRCLVVGRDAMGLIPCFYWWNERVVLVSPSLDAILGQPDVDARFNRVLVAEYLQNIRGFQQVHETFYEDVRRLPPAHTLSVSGGALSLTRYWDPLPPGFAWATESEVARFTDVLGTAVDRSLAAGADSLALSGGFDSVSLAVMAAERRDGRTPLHAMSLRFTDPSCDEGPRQMQVAQALGMPQLMRSLDECLDEDSFVGELRTLSCVSPGPVMSAWQPMYARLLRSAADRGLGRMMTGTGGDEMYYVNMGHAADCLRALDLRGLWRFCQACHATWPGAPARVARYVLWDGAIKGEMRRQARTLLAWVSPRAHDWVLTRRLRRARPPWLVPVDDDLLARLERRPLESPAVEMAPGEGAYVRAMRRLPQSPTFSMELEQSHAWAAQAGFRFLFPYFDRDLVELSLRMPPAHLVAGGRAKAPLRRLVEERLPSVAMPARKVLFGQLFDRVFRLHGARAWAALGGPRILGELGIVDPSRVSAIMEDYFNGVARRSLEAWLVLSMELWLRARSGVP